MFQSDTNSKMVFSSFIFIFLFLPLVLASYFLAPRAARNSILLIFSLAFYGWGAPMVLLPLMVSCAIDYYVSKKLVPGAQSDGWRKYTLVAILGFNLSLLGYYKYANLFVHEINRALGWFQVTPLGWQEVLLPVGISFFTFHKITYLVDVYRGKVQLARSLRDYMLYVVLFSQLIAGPIVRYADVEGEIVKRTESINLFFSGLFRFSIGMGKKLLIADAMGDVANQVFALNSELLSAPWAWLGILAYSFQIYFDFSGYSDMAIALGWMFGFHFKENFNAPYSSRNITDFWRRWHISLSSFMREYLYIPLGGNKGTTFQTYRNLWIVFLLSGLWHGAAWNFVAWGAFHGFFLALDKLCWLKISERLPAALNVLLTFIVVMFGWVLFRAHDLSQALHYMSVMVGWVNPTGPVNLPRAYLIDNRGIVVLLAAALITFFPKFKLEPIPHIEVLGLRRTALRGAVICLVLALSLCYLGSKGYTPFLYFRF